MRCSNSLNDGNATPALHSTAGKDEGWSEFTRQRKHTTQDPAHRNVSRADASRRGMAGDGARMLRLTRSKDAWCIASMAASTSWTTGVLSVSRGACTAPKCAGRCFSRTDSRRSCSAGRATDVGSNVREWDDTQPTRGGATATNRCDTAGCPMLSPYPHARVFLRRLLWPTTSPRTADAFTVSVCAEPHTLLTPTT